MKKAILFVHGLAGGKSTWGNFKSIIESDEQLKDYFVDHYEYKSSLLMYSLSFLGKQGDIYTLADGLKTHIDQFLAEFNEVVLVGHSLGGLIIRQYKNKNQKNNIFFRPSKWLWPCKTTFTDQLAK